METLSDETLRLYAQNVRRALAEGRNLAVERHQYLTRVLGNDTPDPQA